jgi:hypothetical protein
MDTPEIAAIVKALQSFRTPLATRGSTPDEGIRWLIPKLETFETDDMEIQPVIPYIQAMARELAPLAISWANRTIGAPGLRRGVTEIVTKREDSPEVKKRLTADLFRPKNF